LGTALDKIAMVIDAFQQLCARATQEDASSQTVTADKVVSPIRPTTTTSATPICRIFLRLAAPFAEAGLPDLFATLTVPKAEELVAASYRHGNKEKAEIFFLKGMTQAMHRLAEQAHPAFPVTIYYAFKQAENERDGAPREQAGRPSLMLSFVLVFP